MNFQRPLTVTPPPAPRAGLWSRIALLAVTALLAAGLAGCVTSGQPSTPEREGPPTPQTTTGPQATTVTRAAGTSLPAPPPPSPEELVARLECDGEPFERAQNQFAMTDAADANAVLALVIGDMLVYFPGLPLDGYELLEEYPTWATFGYRSGGALKLIALARADNEMPLPGRWFPYTFASCQVHEFDPGVPRTEDLRVWTRNGQPVPVSEVLEMRECGGTRRLAVQGALFIRDPKAAGLSARDVLGTPDLDTTLPHDATATPYRDRERELWLAGDGSAAFVVDTGRTERWPRVRGDELVRVDCN